MKQRSLGRVLAIALVSVSGIGAMGQMLRTHNGANPNSEAADASSDALQTGQMPSAPTASDRAATSSGPGAPMRLTDAQRHEHYELNPTSPVDGAEAGYGASPYDAEVTNISSDYAADPNPRYDSNYSGQTQSADSSYDVAAATAAPAEQYGAYETNHDPYALASGEGSAVAESDPYGTTGQHDHVVAEGDHQPASDPYSAETYPGDAASQTSDQSAIASSYDASSTPSAQELPQSSTSGEAENADSISAQSPPRRLGGSKPALAGNRESSEKRLSRSEQRSAQTEPIAVADASANSSSEASPLAGNNYPATDEANDNPLNADNAQTVSTADSQIGVGQLGPKELDGPQSATLAVTKFAPHEVQVGAAEKYRISVRNAAGTTAKNVRVIDEIPEHTRFVKATPSPIANQGGALEWEIPEIRPGGQFDIEMELVALEEGEIGSVAKVVVTHLAGMRTRATRPQLALSVSSPKSVLKGQNVTFSVKVANTGSGVARNVTLEEIVPEQLEHPDGRELELAIDKLEPGEVRQFDLTLKAAQAGSVLNRLTARGAGDLAVQQDVELEVIAPQLELAVNGPKYRYLETKAAFAISVSNPGTASADDVLLTVKMPPGLEFIEANNAGYYNAERHTVAWSLVSLPAGRAGDVKLIARPTKAGDFALKLDAKSGKELTTEMEHPLRVEGLASLSFSVTDLEDPIEVGAETIYEIRVSNPGSKAASNVRVVGLAPSGLRIVGGKGGESHQIEGDRISFSPIASLAPKAEVAFQVRAVAETDGDLRLRVEISSDEVQPVVKEEPTKVYSAE